MKWCNIINMFCTDMDAEDFDMCECDGMCKDCEECSEVQND